MNDHPAHDVAARRAGGGDLTAATCLAFAIGAWLVASPAIFGYADSDPWWSPMGAGMLLALVGLARAAGAVGSAVMRVTGAASALWLLGSAAWLAAGSAGGWNLAATGGAVLGLAAVGARSPGRVRRPAAARESGHR